MSPDEHFTNSKTITRKSAGAFLVSATLVVLCVCLIAKILDQQQQLLLLAETSYGQKILIRRLSDNVLQLLSQDPHNPLPNAQERRLRREIQQQLNTSKQRLDVIRALIQANPHIRFEALVESLNSTLTYADFERQIGHFTRRIQGLIQSDPELLRLKLENWQPAFVFVSRENFLIQWFDGLNQKLQEETVTRNVYVTTISALLFALCLCGIFLIWWVAFFPTTQKLDRQERELAQNQAHLEHLAYHDALSALPNRKAFNQDCQSLETTQLQRGALSVILLDIDCFKTINDSFGHHAGDQIIRATGTLLKPFTASGFQAYRLGGDEFCLLRHEPIDRDHLAQICQGIVCGFRDRVQLAETRVGFSCSLGAATSGVRDSNIETLLNAADIALYRAKEDYGGDSYVISNSEEAPQQRLGLIERELIKSIDMGHFIPYFEPVFDLQQRTIIGFEALARWQHPERGLLTPAHWLREADRLKLLSKITLKILAHLADAKRLFQAVHTQPFWISLNVTPSLLMTGVILEYAKEHRPTHGLHWLSIETTESIMQDRNYREILRQLVELRRVGVRIFLDDFGTGFASLSNLKHFPFDAIKLDKHFTSEHEHGAQNQHITQAIVSLAQRLGKRIIYEGIETEYALRTIQSLGGQWGQGHLMSTAQPEQQILQILQQQQTA